MISPDEIIKAKASIAEQFDVANDHAATGEKPSELFNNYQKLSIGGGELRRKDLAKCIRTYYNPIFTEDIFGMHNAFRQAARVRNLIMGVDLDFAIDKIEDGFWTAARVHHYPTGGGFMQEHVDDYIPEFYAGTQIDTYYQPLIVMSRRGEGDSCDYSSGGGFFSLNRERIYYDDSLELGTVVIYNTKSLHGITEVDPHKPFSQQSVAGRYSGLVSLYRDFS